MIRMGRSKTGTSALLAYPGFGYPTAGGQCRIYLSGVVWQEPVVFNLRQRMMIRMLAGVMKATTEELQSQPFQDRIAPFMAEADGRQPIIVELAGRTHRLEKKTRKNGHFRDFVSLSNAEVESAAEVDEFGNRTLPYRLAVADSQGAPTTGLIYLLDRRGTSVISDIDDTIKDSAVGDRQQLLSNTFLRDFRSVAGMADVYRHWSDQGASFHYVSSSPWQLFISLLAMNVEHRFPAGTMHLRNFRLRDQLLRKVILRRQGKATTIRFLLNNLPERNFVLVGDSGEKDPEIYRKICLKYPTRIKAMLIREVPNRPLEGERLRRLTDALPANLFGKFTDAAELQDLAKRMFEN